MADIQGILAGLQSAVGGARQPKKPAFDPSTLPDQRDPSSLGTYVQMGQDEANKEQQNEFGNMIASGMDPAQAMSTHNFESIGPDIVRNMSGPQGWGTFLNWRQGLDAAVKARGGKGATVAAPQGSY
jgi:hypothetical protein